MKQVAYPIWPDVKWNERTIKEVQLGAIQATIHSLWGCCFHSGAIEKQHPGVKSPMPENFGESMVLLQGELRRRGEKEIFPIARRQAGRY